VLFLKRLMCLMLVIVLLLTSACTVGEKKTIHPIELSISGLSLGMPADDFSEFIYGEPGKITDKMVRMHFSSTELHMNESTFMGYTIAEETLATVYFDSNVLKAVQFAVLCESVESLELDLTDKYGEPQVALDNPCGKQWNGANVEGAEKKPFIYYIPLGNVNDLTSVALVVSI